MALESEGFGLGSGFAMCSCVCQGSPVPSCPVYGGRETHSLPRPQVLREGRGRGRSKVAQPGLFQWKIFNYRHGKSIIMKNK